MADVSDLFASLEQRAEQIVEATVANVEGRLDRAVPRSGRSAGTPLAETRETGQLERSADTLSVSIEYTAPYAEVTDKGSDDGEYYDIVPVNAEFLVFEGTNDFAGQIIFTKHVDHPPQVGTGWFTQSFEGDIWVTD